MAKAQGQRPAGMGAEGHPQQRLLVGRVWSSPPGKAEKPRWPWQWVWGAMTQGCGEVQTQGCAAHT